MFSLMPTNSGDLNGMGGEKVNTRGRNQVVLLRVRTCSCKERAMVSGAATIQCCNEACFHVSRRDFEVMRTLCGPDDNVGPRMRFLPRGEERLRQQESVTLATNLSTPRHAPTSCDFLNVESLKSCLTFLSGCRCGSAAPVGRVDGDRVRRSVKASERRHKVCWA